MQATLAKKTSAVPVVTSAQITAAMKDESIKTSSAATAIQAVRINSAIKEEPKENKPPKKEILTGKASLYVNDGNIYSSYIRKMADVTTGVNTRSPRWQLHYALRSGSFSCSVCNLYMHKRVHKRH